MRAILTRICSLAFTIGLVVCFINCNETGTDTDGGGGNVNDNICPVAIIGEPSQRDVSIGTAEPLISLSVDPDQSPEDMTLQWVIVSSPEGSSPVLDDETAQETTFTSSLPGEYVVTLTVTDGDQECDGLDRLVDTVTLVVNQDPVVDAGDNQVVNHTTDEGQFCAQASLVGSAIDPLNGTLGYQWAIVGYPTEETEDLVEVSFVDATAASTGVEFCIAWTLDDFETFDPADFLGDYIFQLTATSDAQGLSGSDPVDVTVTNVGGPVVREPFDVQIEAIQHTYLGSGQCQVQIVISDVSIEESEDDPMLYSWTVEDQSRTVLTPQDVTEDLASPNTTLVANFDCSDFENDLDDEMWNNGSFQLHLEAEDVFGMQEFVASQTFSIADTMFGVLPDTENIEYDCEASQLVLPVVVTDINYTPVRVYLSRANEDPLPDVGWEVECQEDQGEYSCEVGTGLCEPDWVCESPDCDPGCCDYVFDACPLNSGQIQLWAEDPFGNLLYVDELFFYDFVNGCDG